MPAHPDPLLRAVRRREDWMLERLSALVAAASPSGAEQPALAVFEAQLAELGLATERIALNSRLIADSPLYSGPAHRDNGRYNLLARHVPGASGGRSLLINGHLDVAPSGPERLWSHPPFAPRVADGWLHGRGAAEMKAGLVCALLALQALRDLRWQPAGTVALNAVLEGLDTGHGSLATLHALQHGLGLARLGDFDAVIVPKPTGEAVLSAQLGESWLALTLSLPPGDATSEPTGPNPIELALALFEDLKPLQAEWNRPEHRHPAFAALPQPIQFNLGRIEGGDSPAALPGSCHLGLRVGHYPDQSPEAVLAELETRLRAKAATLAPGLVLDIHPKGLRAPGCVYPLDSPALQALAQAHRQVNRPTGDAAPDAGTVTAAATLATLASTRANDGRHFRLLSDLPVAVYGPLARQVHGLDEAVSVASMQRVAATLARYIVDWCGVQPL